MAATARASIPWRSGGRAAGCVVGCSVGCAVGCVLWDAHYLYVRDARSAGLNSSSRIAAPRKSVGNAVAIRCKLGVSTVSAMPAMPLLPARQRQPREHRGPVQEVIGEAQQQEYAQQRANQWHICGPEAAVAIAAKTAQGAE